jgi:hydroxyacylglutathione hydrolase
MLRVTAQRAFSDNYLWLIHAPTDPARVAVVDPGDGAAVEKGLKDRNLELAAILVTHHHPDHVGGVAQLKEHWDVPVFGPAHENIPGDARPLVEGDEVDLPELGLHFDVLDVPGHTSGHIAYVGHGALFCGDTLFSAGCGRLFEGTAAQMSQSLAKFAALPQATRVYCAHEYTVNNLKFARAVEPENRDVLRYLEECEEKRARDEMTLPSTIGLELNVNPFLRCGRESVKQAAERNAGRALHDATEILAVVRQWKDGFRG